MPSIKTGTTGHRYFDAGVGAIFLDNVRCRGAEPSLASCEHSDVGVHGCWHREVVGVVCQGKIAIAIY